MEKTCAVTGHRPMRFSFKYNENDALCGKIKEAILEQFRQMYEENGVRHILVGGALGVDMWAGEMALRLQEMPGYGALQLHMALPFEGHDARWDDRSRARLAFLMRHSAECVVVSGQDSRESYLARNRYLVDRADILLAVCDRERNLRSGTLYTVRYARKRKLPIVLIHPDTAQVGREMQNGS